MKQQVIVFEEGKPRGVFDSMTKAGEAVKVSKATVSLLIRSGKETIKGFSFDYCLWN
jgi:hypothetical protein